MNKKHSKFIYPVLILFTAFFSWSCSSTESATKEKSGKEQKNSVYPGWYQVHNEVRASGNHYVIYVTALGSDSTSAVTKAFEKAKAHLEAGISGKIESVRKSLASQINTASSPAFLVALRNAENRVSGEIEQSNVAVKRVKGYSSYRGFVEARISRSEVKNVLDSELSDYHSTWIKIKANL